jgi:hypothetical protein
LAGTPVLVTGLNLRQSGTSEKLPFIAAAVGRPPHFSSKLKSAALCREAATPVLVTGLNPNPAIQSSKWMP